ncbi:MAG: flagellar hook-length control protein FliK [Magnetococcus sp. YQC-9]
MTLSPMFLPRVESRPPASSERPPVARSAEEESNRFFEQALQRAEIRKSSEVAERDEARADARSEAADRDRDAAQDAAEAADTREAREARKAAQQEDAEAVDARKGETKEPKPGEEVDSAAAVDEKTLRELVNANGKSRPIRGKKGEEPAWLAMPHAALLASGAGSHGSASVGESPLPFLSGVSANIPSQGVQSGVPQSSGVDGGVNPTLLGQAPVEGAVQANLARGLAESVGTRGQARVDLNLPASMTAAEDKNDFAFAMRLVSDGARAVDEKPAISSQNTLSPQSSSFGDELAGEVGRLRIISRAGGAEQVRISLNPRELGSLDMRLTVDGDHQVHLMITAESDAAREALNKQLPQLREALARQNLGMGEVTVHVDDGSGGGAAPQWGFDGGNGTTEERREALFWRSGRGQDEGVRPLAEGVPPPPSVNRSVSGLSLFA